MKTKLIFLVMLIVCISCGTNNKTVSDAQKEKIKGEVKEVVNNLVKGFNELNIDMVLEQLLNSPDFVYSGYGKTQSYDEFKKSHRQEDMDKYMLNMKYTLVAEKYSVLDESTVLYTANNKWLINMKDGNSSVYDPSVMLCILKKIDGRWKVIYWMESFVKKST